MKKIVISVFVAALVFGFASCKTEVQYPTTVICDCGENHNSSNGKDEDQSQETPAEDVTPVEETVKFSIKNSHNSGYPNTDSSITFELYDEDYVKYREGTIFPNDTITINHCKKGDFTLYVRYAWYNSGSTHNEKKMYCFTLDKSSLLKISGQSALTFDFEDL